MMSHTPRGQGPERKCRTPRRERPGSGYQEPAAGPRIEHVLNDASQFPELPKDLNVIPRGRKARRSHTAWAQIPSEGGMPSRTRSLSRDMREEPSQQGSSHNDEEAPRGSARSRAYSHDAGVDAFADIVEPRTVRSALKKPKDNAAFDAGELEKQETDKRMEALLQAMRDMDAHLKSSGRTDSAAQMGTLLNLNLTRLQTSKPTEDKAEPSKKTCVDFGQDDEDSVAIEEVVRPRRLSNPRAPAMELPTGGSWEYPLTKEEKKARVVMISDAEIDGLQEENAALQEEVGRRTVDQSK